MGYLRGPEGQASSKRLVGIGYAVGGLFIVVIKLLTDSDIGIEWYISTASISLTALGISAVEKFKPLATTDPDPPNPPGDPKK